MSEKAAKSEQSFSQTCAKAGISEMGKRWLDITLDPFKDLNMPTAGFPDEIQLQSVVETIHDTITLKAPASAAGGIWDANIFLDQLYTQVTMFQTNTALVDNNFVATGQLSTGLRGGLVVRSAGTGIALGMATSDPVASISLKQDVLTDPNSDFRVVGIGMEVHNTTAEINKQGAIITYRIADVPSTNTVANFVVDATGTLACIPTSCPGAKLAEPPLSANSAIDLPGSLQWEAADGCYVVAILDNNVNPLANAQAICPITQESGINFIPQLTITGASRMVTMPFKNSLQPYSLCGAYLTGLSNSTTLQVNLTYYVEIFPSKDNILRRVSSPSPPLDSRALKMYGDIVRNLPTGVQVSDNFLGAFIAGIASIARTALTYLPTIGKVLGTAYNIAETAYKGAGMVDQYLSGNTQPKLQLTNGNNEIIVSPNPSEQRLVNRLVQERQQVQQTENRLINTVNNNNNNLTMTRGKESPTLRVVRTRKAKKNYQNSLAKYGGPSTKTGNTFVSL